MGRKERPEHESHGCQHDRQRGPDPEKPRHQELAGVLFLDQAVGHDQAAQKEECLDRKRARVIENQQPFQEIQLPFGGKHGVGVAIYHHGRGNQPEDIQIVVFFAENVGQEHGSKIRGSGCAKKSRQIFDGGFEREIEGAMRGSKRAAEGVDGKPCVGAARSRALARVSRGLQGTLRLIDFNPVHAPWWTPPCMFSMYGTAPSVFSEADRKDPDPRTLAHHWCSRPAQSAASPSFRRPIRGQGTMARMRRLSCKWWHILPLVRVSKPLHAFS